MGPHCKARRGLRALVVGTVMSVALTGVAMPGAGAAPPANIQRAQRGAQFLANEIKANGGFLEGFGKADPVSTAYAVIGLRAVGVDRAATNKAIAYLKTKLGTEVQAAGKDAPGALANYILAAVATGSDPRHFGGTAPKNNLVNRLLATARKTGTDKGLFGGADPTFDGAFRQGLALAALKAVKIPATDARVTAAISWLTKQQCTNGLWLSYRASTATACPAADPVTFTGPDTNSTSLAAQGLAAWAKFPRRATVLDSLRQIQAADGGFPFVAAPGQTSDPNSTALVIQGLLAEKNSPASAVWQKGTGTPYTALASYQIACNAPGYGAFMFPGSTDANVFATVQAVPAMAGKKLPALQSAASVTLPLTPC